MASAFFSCYPNSRYLIQKSCHKSHASMWFIVFVSCFDFTALLSLLYLYLSYLYQSIIYQSKKGKDGKVGVHGFASKRNRIRYLVEASPIIV